MFLKNRNISSKIKSSKVTGYAALKVTLDEWQFSCHQIRCKCDKENEIDIYVNTALLYELALTATYLDG